MAGEGLDPHEAGEVHTGDVVPVPPRETLPMNLTPEQHAAKLAEMKRNQAIMGAASRRVLAEQPDQIPPTAPPSPDMITSDQVPKPAEEEAAATE